MPACLGLKLFDDLGGAGTALQLGHHLDPCVGSSDDSGALGDSAAADPCGIAGTVEPLVVVVDPCDLLIGEDLADELGAEFGVRLELLALWGAQTMGLRPDLLGDAEHADVTHKRGLVQELRVGGGPAHSPRRPLRKVGDARRGSGALATGRIHCASHQPQAGQGLAPPVGTVPGHRHLWTARAEPGDSVAARRACLAECQLGMTEDLTGIVVGLACIGDTARDRHQVAGRQADLSDQRLGAFSGEDRAAGVGLGEKPGKPARPDPGDNVTRADQSAHDAGGGREHAVANGVSWVVRTLMYVVHFDDDKAEIPSIPPSPSEFGEQTLVERGAVIKPCQRIT